MFYTKKSDYTNFATMKKLVIMSVLLMLAAISFGQTVPVQAKTFRITYGSDSYSINLNGDSILIDASDFMWFADKFGSDTLLFGDGTYMTTAFVSGVNDTGYVKTTGDTVKGLYRFNSTISPNFYMDWDYTLEVHETGCASRFRGSGVSTYKGSPDISATLEPPYLFFDSATSAKSTYYSLGGIDLYQTNFAIKSDIGSYIHFNYNDSVTTIYNKLILESPNSKDEIITINNIKTGCDSTVKADDESIVLTNGISGWGEVYAFNAGVIDEWAEFIISSDGAVYLKSNSTDVVNTDTANKLCIFDNGSGVTIRNRLGGTRTIKYIIHH